MQKRVEKWMRRNGVCDKDFTKIVFSKLLGIKKEDIILMKVKNQCINIYARKFIYKVQMYGNSMIRDLNNRRLFALYDQELVCPIQIKYRKPLIVAMPRMTEITAYDEAACFVLRKIKEYGHDSKFKIKDYPLIMYGLSSLRGFPEGIRMREKLYRYLHGKEGVVLRVGPVHGDFHRGNILTANGKLFLIDFDCFRENDIQAVDVLYFVLEEVRHKRGYRRPWMDEWLYLYNNIEEIKNEYQCIKETDIDFQLGLILLLLERMAQEEQNEERFAVLQKDSIRRINLAIERLAG